MSTKVKLWVGGIAAFIVVVAIGAAVSPDKPADSAASSATPRPAATKAPAPSAKPKPAADVSIPGATAKVSSCIDSLGFKTRPAGNVTRIESPSGRAVGNVQTHASATAAKRFDAQLQVPFHAQGGRLTVVLFATAKDVERTTVASCITYGR